MFDTKEKMDQMGFFTRLQKLAKWILTEFEKEDSNKAKTVKKELEVYRIEPT